MAKSWMVCIDTYRLAFNVPVAEKPDGDTDCVVAVKLDGDKDY